MPDESEDGIVVDHLALEDDLRRHAFSPEPPVVEAAARGGASVFGGPGQQPHALLFICVKCEMPIAEFPLSTASQKVAVKPTGLLPHIRHGIQFHLLYGVPKEAKDAA